MSLFICSNCGYGSASWIGKCPSCNQWNTFVQKQDISEKNTEKIIELTTKSLSAIRSFNQKRLNTGIYEFDRVLGGGFIEGEVILLTGEPGIGKSTLILQAFQNLSCLYISGEESAEQVKSRAERLKVELKKILFSDTLQVEGIVEGIKKIRRSISIIVIDSIQTVYSKEIEGQPGSPAQLKEAAMSFIRLAKKEKIPLILIGHITKEGDIAGPKMLEHMVDAVLSFEGERISQFRILRSEKNRFGPADEIGIFEMTGEGLKEVSNPLAFLDSQKQAIPGKVIIGSLEGKRPLFFEIQVLAVTTNLAIPRRVVKGVDYNKLLLLLAVLKKHLHLALHTFDIYVNVVGGVEIKSPAADFGIAAAIYSSVKNIPLPSKAVFIGEVGLLGEIRPIFGESRIISEAKRLGLLPIYTSAKIDNIKRLTEIVGK